jgi:PIN domain nuclease of toxin-antitoxin system
MRLLVDTQCWLWMAAAPERLSPQARALVESARNDVLVSAASAWEIAIKHALGKLRLPEPPARYVPSRLVALGATPLPVSIEHALAVSPLPAHHRDPFDRLLVAQAQIEDVPIVTADPVMARYDVAVIPA